MTTTENTSVSSLRNRKNGKATKQTTTNSDSTTEDKVNYNDHINNNNIDDTDDHSAYIIIPLIERMPLLRLDVYPFAIIYCILIWIDNNNNNNNIITIQSSKTTIRNQEGGGDDNNIYSILLSLVTKHNIISILFGCTLLTHIIIVLLSQWNIKFRSTIGYYKSTLADRTLFHKWTHCLIQSSHNQQHDGSVTADIVPIQNQQSNNDTIIINFHDHIFRCHYNGSSNDTDVTLWQTQSQSQQQDNGFSSNEEDNNSGHDANVGIQDRQKEQQLLRFIPVRYPINLSLLFYMKWYGHISLESTITANTIYNTNTMILQLPNFIHLLIQQLLAPFFLFQFFCVILWSLDEYWYYAIFTLFAIIIFESTMVYNRIQNLTRLHQLSHKYKNQRIYVRRGGPEALMTKTKTKTNGIKDSSHNQQWILIFVSELLPGDWISISGNSIPVPADILLMNGTAVCDEALLTGESIPQLKQSLDISSYINKLNVTKLDIQSTEYKQSILFGGTILLSGTIETSSSSSSLSPPDKGVEGIVLRTGFETSQGNLLRTMAHSSNSADSVHTADTFVFIIGLILCAICAASYVLYESYNDDKRNQFRLLLHVIIIITSVVPPELPMELSLAITNSVASLMKRCKVYCTEHYRIAWAGQINICCFDKTGTLTSDEMNLKGIRVFDKQEHEQDNGSTTTIIKNKQQQQQEEDNLLHPLEDDIPYTTRRIMAGCNSLVITTIGEGKSKRSKMIGDPLELRILEESKYQMIGNNIVAPKIDTSDNDNDEMDNTTKSPVATVVGNKSISILHRFPFSSKLKRMTTLVTEEGGMGIIWALCKGAPETIKTLLNNKTIPSNYDTVSMYHMSRGRRVLAMAYREVGNVKSLQSLKDNGREYIENNFIFAGFLIMECPLKSDSKIVISELKKSGHDVIMITGDAILTATEVAKQVGIISNNTITREQQTKKNTPIVVYRIQKRSSDNDNSLDSRDPLSYFEYVPLLPDNDIIKPIIMSTKMNLTMKENIAFCISGDVLVEIAIRAYYCSEKSDELTTKLSLFDEKNVLLSRRSLDVLKHIVPSISVFARHAPHQKEAVIAALNLAGYQTLMCGDGTNDVGALKRAHVGISLISAPEIESKQRSASKKLSKATREESGTKKKSKKIPKGKKRSTIEESLRQLQEVQEELNYVELGDASVAAPFTSRALSIKCCKDVIQQGRCTLVTMLQIYKILGINCLVNALVLSRLFLYGVKHGDRQLTVLGLVVALLFFLVSCSEPLSTLSTTRPPASVLCSEAILSIIGQFGIHSSIILAVAYYALMFVDPFDPSLIPDGPFNPNVLNSCTFLLTCLATVNTFAVNYRGRPFMQDLRENTMLYRSILLCYAILTICALEVFPPIGDLLQMSDLPTIEDLEPSQREKLPDFLQSVDFNIFLYSLMVLDTVLVFGFERQIRKYYDSKTKTTHIAK